MILVSCREDFDDSRRFSSRNQIRNYPFMPNLDQFQELDEMNLGRQMQGKHVLILIHGFRNTLQDVANSYQQLLEGLIANGLKGPGGYDLVIGFTWPGFTTALGFFPAVPFASRAGGYFRTLLELASKNAKTVDVQTHSLGARVALQALAAGTEGFIDNLMLTAPAVDDECLEPKHEFNQALEGCRRCLVYHSNQDETLGFAYPIATFDKALGFDGPEHPDIIRQSCPDVFVIDCQRVVGSHGAYRNTPEYYQHWKRVIGELPLQQFESL